MVTEMSKIEKLGSAQQLPLVIVAISEWNKSLFFIWVMCILYLDGY
jgi:hypothetical protein